MNRMMTIAAVAAMALAIAAWWLTRETGPAGDGGPMAEVSVPELTREARNGKTIFDANCERCHGENASGREGLGPPLVHKIYEPGHHADFAFLRAVMQGVRAHHWSFGDMAPVEGVTDRQVGQIIAYVRELQRANGIQ